MSGVQDGPPLPRRRGDLSAGVLGHLCGTGTLPAVRSAAGADPYGDDLQLA